jgi:hypothetical protein
LGSKHSVQSGSSSPSLLDASPQHQHQHQQQQLPYLASPLEMLLMQQAEAGRPLAELQAMQARQQQMIREQQLRLQQARGSSGQGGPLSGGSGGRVELVMVPEVSQHKSQ